MRRLLILIPILAMILPVQADTTFTYQGQLQENGQPFNGTVDMEFELFDGEDNPVVDGPIIINGVPVSDGLFQVELDFGDAPYEQGLRLRITVDGDELSPLQPVTAAPLAVRSLSGGEGGGSAWTATPDGIVYSDGQVRVGAPGSSSRTFVVRSLTGEDPFVVFTSDGSGVIHGRDNRGVTIGLGTTASAPDQGLRVSGDTLFDSRVGIGTANPESQFTVSGQDSLFVAGDFVGGGFAATAHKPGANTAFLAGPEGSQSAFFIGDPVVLGTDTEFLMSSNASIGGTVQAGMVQVETLSTATDIELCRSPLSGGGAFLAFCSSSLRYKNEIASFENASEIITQLRPVSFRWNNSGQESIGLIAEEVADLDPRLVTFNNDGQIEGIKSRSLAAVLIKALQEQGSELAAELAKRDARIAALQTKLDTQRRETAERLAALEALLLDGAGIAAK